MKLSKYNTIVPYENGFVYHNSFTNKFLLIDPMLKDLLATIHHNEDLEELQEIHPEFHDALVEFGYIVQEEEDEIEKVRQIIDIVDKQEQYFHMIVNPTMNCNFNCWYCYETHEKKSRMTDEVVDKIELLVDNILTNTPTIKTMIVSFFGGEPLLFYNQMSVLMKKVNKAVQQHAAKMQIAITTNGLLLNEDIVAELHQYEVLGFQITLDGNRDKHDKVRFVSKTRGSFDTIIKNIKLLVRNGLFVTLRINYTTDNLNGLEDILEEFNDLTLQEKKLIALSLQKVFQEPLTRELSDKVKAFTTLAEVHGISHRSALLGNTVRNSCYADKVNQATINYNGDVYKCNARVFNQANKEGDLTNEGKISWNEQHNKRLVPKLTNKPCLECSIMPICGGGCSQMIVENAGKDYCVHDFNEDSKQETILSMFLDEYTEKV